MATSFGTAQIDQSLLAFSRVSFIIQYSLHGETWNYFRDSNDKNNDFLNDQQHTPNSFSDSGVPAIFSCVLFKILSHSLCDPRLLVHFYRLCWRTGPEECRLLRPLIEPPLEFRWPMTPRRKCLRFTLPQKTTQPALSGALITADLSLLEMHVNFIVTSDLYPTTKSSTGWRN